MFSGSGQNSGYQNGENCEWDGTVGFTPTSSTIMVGQTVDGSGYPVLDTANYTVSMTSITNGANCNTYRCVVYPGSYGYSTTRIVVKRKSDGATIYDSIMNVDFSAQ
jgi:hypothetical protein